MHMKLMEEETMRGEEEEEKGDDNSEGERRIMAGGGGEKKRNVNKGCIKAGKGPWLVHRTTKDGSVITRFRYPSDRERQNNKRRERARRSMTRRIFQGLRAHGNYELPKHADSNDLLRALCQEAGWHVDEDGHVSRQETQMTSFNISGRRHFYPVSMGADQLGDHEDYCKCIHSFSAKGRKLGCTFNFPTATSRNQYDQNGFTLSPSRHRLATNENWR